MIKRMSTAGTLPQEVFNGTVRWNGNNINTSLIITGTNSPLYRPGGSFLYSPSLNNFERAEHQRSGVDLCKSPNLKGGAVSS
jgi:hypothetical protein